MSDSIPTDVESFILQFITSVEQLEVLLLLFRTAPRSWTGEAVSRELRTAEASSSAKLEDLRTRGFLVVSDPTVRAYRFDPRRPDDQRVVAELATWYSTRQVTIIGMIFSRPSDSVRSFADAFKLRRKDDDG